MSKSREVPNGVIVKGTQTILPIVKRNVPQRKTIMSQQHYTYYHHSTLRISKNSFSEPRGAIIRYDHTNNCGAMRYRAIRNFTINVGDLYTPGIMKTHCKILTAAQANHLCKKWWLASSKLNEAAIEDLKELCRRLNWVLYEE